jgi:ABC-2 type transport system ATP-binding protein
MAEIAKLSSVSEAAMFGNGLHLVAKDGPLAALEVRRLLESDGYRIERIEKIVPSLEDVFVSLIEARDRAHEPQQEVRG